MTFLDHLAPRVRRPQSWTSTPDLDDDDIPVQDKSEVEVSMALPRRRHTVDLDMPPVEESFTLKRPPRPQPNANKSPDVTISRGDSLAERVRKMQLIKKQNSIDREIRSRQSSSMEKYIKSFTLRILLKFSYKWGFLLFSESNRHHHVFEMEQMKRQSYEKGHRVHQLTVTKMM